MLGFESLKFEFKFETLHKVT